MAAIGCCVALATAADGNAARQPARASKLASASLDAAERTALAAIRADAQSDQIARTMADQAFSIALDSRVLHLVPVSYASVKARNGVCDLLVLDDRFKLTGRVRLAGVDFDGDEVVARCTNVIAASFRFRPADHRVDAVYLMATGVFNTNRNQATVVTIDGASGQVSVNDKLTNALDDGSEPKTLNPLMARLKRLPAP